MSEPVHSEQRQQRKLSKTARTSTTSATSSIPLRRTPPSPSPSPTPSRSPSRLPAPSRPGSKTTTPRNVRRVSSGLGQGAGSLGGLSSPDPHRIARPSPPALGRRTSEKSRRFGTPRNGSAHFGFAATPEHSAVTYFGTMSSEEVTKEAEKILEQAFFQFIHNEGLKKMRVSDDLERFQQLIQEMVPAFDYEFDELVDHYKSQDDFKARMVTLDELKNAYYEVFEAELVADLAKAIEAQNAKNHGLNPLSPHEAPSTPTKGSFNVLGGNTLSPRFDPARDDASLLSTVPEAQSTPSRNDSTEIKSRLHDEIEARKRAEEDLRDKSKEYEGEIERLKRMVRERENEVQEANDKMWELECELNNRKNPTPAASVRPRKDTSEHDQELEEKEEHIRYLEDQLATVEAERDQLKEKNERLAQSADDSHEEHVKNFDMMKEMAVEIEDLGKHIERLKEENENMKSKVAEAEEAVLKKELREEVIRQQKAQILNLEKEVATAKQDMQRLDEKHKQERKKKVLLAGRKETSVKEQSTETEPVRSQDLKDTGTSSSKDQPSSFVGKHAQIQQQTMYESKCANTIVTQTPEAGLATSVEDWLEWQRDPTMAAIRHLQKEGLTTRTMLGLKSGTMETGQPRTIEDYEQEMAAPKSDEIKTFKDSENRNWPEGMQPLSEDQLRELADHPLGGEDKQTETDPLPELSATSTTVPPAAQPVPFPDDQYSESIITSHADMVRLQHLATDEYGKLTEDDTEFLTNFVRAQSENPSRFIIPSLWQLANRVEAARRRYRRAKDYNFNAPIPQIHKPTLFEWPWQILKEIFLTPTLDRADHAAMAHKKTQELHDSYRKYVKAELEAEDSDGARPAAAPFGMPADILRASPRPAAAWSLLTNFLWIVMAYLMVHNVYFYWLMKRDQKEWLVSNGEMDSVGWGTGCYRVCNDGYWWRAKAAVSEFFEEHVFGPSESQIGKW